MEKINQTPYALETVVIYDRQGNETLLVMVKGTFDYVQGASRVASEQRPVNQADEYRGDPVESSILLATDMLPLRPQTGVTLSGHAVCPGPEGSKVGKLNVGVKLGALQQTAVVFGDRVGYQNIDRPEPFERIALCWENAFGGYDRSHDKEKHHTALEDNPVGKGFLAAKSKQSASDILLPNIEDPAHPLRSPHEPVPAVGFGAVSPGWLARRRYAGTYDEQWQKERAPLLPDDFDDRFLQAAPAALTAEGYLQGDEECVLLGMHREGRIAFPLNAPAPTVGVRFHGAGVRSKPKLESVHIDSAAQQYLVTWKSAISIQGKAESLLNIEARIL